MSIRWHRRKSWDWEKGFHTSTRVNDNETCIRCIHQIRRYNIKRYIQRYVCHFSVSSPSIFFSMWQCYKYKFSELVGSNDLFALLIGWGMGKGNEDESEACEFEMIAWFFTVLLLGNLLGVELPVGWMYYSKEF